MHFLLTIKYPILFKKKTLTEAHKYAEMATCYDDVSLLYFNNYVT